ncbi:MAG TPA: hypothetical protein EYP14_12620, partial [Planctomycetaceae bacterium]|nr:hypothetical protein [Planctomycetaceae bacterium]
MTDPAGNDLAVTVNGTNGADEITAQGQATNAVDVTVNDGPTVSYTGVANLSLLAQNGDDNITVDVNVVGLGVAITANGGLPTTGSDALRVTGVDGDPADAVAFTPTSADDGTLTVTGQAINIVNVESVVYDGQADGDNLTVMGAGRFIHTPGSNVDAGTLQVDSDLGITYVNLGAAGTVTANGTGAADTLAVQGTGGSDTLAIAFTGSNAIGVDLTSAAGTHVALRSTAVENYEINALEGDDDINLTAPVNATGSFTVYGGGPSAGSDTLNLTGAAGTIETVIIRPDATNRDDQDILGLGAQIDTTGLELITYTGMDGDDTLTVEPGAGDDMTFVSRGVSRDVIAANSLPTIEYESVNNVNITNTGGTDTVEIAPTNLSGFAGAFTVNGDAVAPIDDVLRLVGTEAADTVTSGTTTVTVNGTTITAGTNLDELQINTLGDDDTVTMGNFGLATIIDGGSGADTVNAAAMAGAPVTLIGGAGDDTLTG